MPDIHVRSWEDSGCSHVSHMTQGWGVTPQTSSDGGPNWLRMRVSGAFLHSMGAVTQKNRPTLPLAMASDRSLSSASPSSRAPHESPCLAMAGAGSSTTIQRLLPIRSARPRERFSDLLTMIDGKSMATLSYNTLWVFDLRARLRAQQSSLLMRLESCVT